MPEQVNIHAAKTHLSKLADRAHNGEEIILAKNGKPYARLVPLEAPTVALRPLGSLGIALSPATLEELLAPLGEDELEEWG